MAAEQATALVVRGTDWSETSRITTLFTREFGKLRGLAKGGRRLKSSFDCSFDLLSVCRVVFLRKAQGGLDLLTEARMEEQFPALRASLPALNAGYYVAELLSDGTQDYDPHPDLFDAALDTLRKLGGYSEPTPGTGVAVFARGASPGGSRESSESQPGLAPRANPPEASPNFPHLPSPPSVLDLVTGFELVWLKELGYSPRLDVCTGCGKAVPAGVPRVWFSAAAGGVVCTPCGPTQPDRRPLSGDALRVLAGGAPAGPVRAEVRAVLGQVVSFVLGRRPRMHRFLADG